jgi:fructokinase
MCPAAASRPVLFGEVLFDHFPDGSLVLGGAPFNVAWHLQAFGAAPLLISRVGRDPLGERIRTAMGGWGMDEQGLQLDQPHPTGTVEVRIRDGEPSFDILPERAYDFIDANALPPLQGSALVYHGSLALRGACNRRALEQILRACAAPVFLDVNLRPPWWDAELLQSLLERARWVKLNEAELGLLAPAGPDVEQRAAALLEVHGLAWVLVTLGAAGALAIDGQGRVHRAAPAPALRVMDTVGAGDAFAAVTLLGLLRGWDLATVLARAQAFAGGVVEIRGATPQVRDFYAPTLAEWGIG